LSGELDFEHFVVPSPEDDLVEEDELPAVLVLVDALGWDEIIEDSTPCKESLTPAFRELSIYINSRTNAKRPPSFNHRDLCPPVIETCLYESTLSDPLPQMLRLNGSSLSSCTYLFGLGKEDERLRGPLNER